MSFAFLTIESLILAQNEHWRRGLGMQVERESSLRGVSRVANGTVTRGKPTLRWGITLLTKC